MFDRDFINTKYFKDTGKDDSETTVVDNICSENFDVLSVIDDEFLPDQEMRQFPR